LIIYYAATVALLSRPLAESKQKCVLNVVKALFALSEYHSLTAKFWVVTKPNNNSQLIDILFNTDMKIMELQFKGGESDKEIIGIFTAKNETEKVAKMAILKAGAVNKF
jgi:hypothetical protein